MYTGGGGGGGGCCYGAKVPIEGGGSELGVNFVNFEEWWKRKAGVAANQGMPVLPEFMVRRVGEKINATHRWERVMQERSKRTSKLKKSKTLRDWELTKIEAGGNDDASDQNRLSHHWRSLKEKLFTLVHMQSSWGSLNSLYAARTESLYADNPLPPYIRDPDSSFSASWDLSSVVFLLYVTVTVPLRVCFGLDIELWSVSFFVEMVVDLFFCAE